MQATDVDAAQVVASAMDEWKAGIDTHDPGRVSAVFTEDAVFQGLRPYGVGRQTVAEYYDSQPIGMTVTYRVLQSRSLAGEVVLGYLAAVFGYVDRPAVKLAIGVVLTRSDDTWQIAQYQASPLAENDG
ncbi:nuclear transport factor 2 family protein [Mycobacterium sp. 1274761.0]|uniref:nuclear transport factor 2 family protein n=1 Tax=Mycobacterium sp. 1274761.0 TaxID=1834077 RepID=UPI001E447D7E|nr:nuclear transport factor 2 family protein [Mycobacterium sp. 1274761.0]